MDKEDFMGAGDLVEQMNTEVKRVSDLFRFILKYKRHFQPSGIEFSDLRQYLVTDDASRIDWKNSAKTQDLYVKEYEEERDMDTFIILDVSDSMLFGTADKTKAEYAAVMAGALAFAAVDAGIRVGFGVFGDSGTTILPDGGKPQYRRVLHEATNFDNYGGTFNLEDVLTDLVGKIQANTAIFLISDFVDVEGDWKSKLHVASEKFRHVMGIMVRDKRDYTMPEAGNVRFQAMEGNGQMVTNTSSIKEEFEEAAARQEEQVEQELKGSGASFMKVDTRDSFAAAFASYFDSEFVQW
jgi:uncharacterized protein (DUF58 family)